MHGQAELDPNVARDPADFTQDQLAPRADSTGLPALDTVLAAIPAEANPFDQACMDLMSRVAAFFGEAASAPSFCGMSVDEVREGDQLISLRLVPCDLIAGEPVRREKR